MFFRSDSKTASISHQPHISLTTSNPEIDAAEAELRHRRVKRNLSDDLSSERQMISTNDDDEQDLLSKTNESTDEEVKIRRHSANFGIDSYRPLNSILKSSSTGMDDTKNGASFNDKGGNNDELNVEPTSNHLNAQLLNRNSPKRSPLTSPLVNVRLPTIMADAEFIGEFIPGRPKKNDIELEPLLAAENDEDEQTTPDLRFTEKDDDDQISNGPGKGEKKPKLEQKTIVNENISTTDTSESAWMILLQVTLPFFIAGCGTVGAGLVLDKVQHHRVFAEVPQIFILVPALLGLKGNLEMTLASRLSTLANLGQLDTRKEKLRQIVGNLALIQAQAAVIAFLAAVFAIVLGWVPKGEFRLDHALLLCASSLATASLASFILGAIMVIVVLLSKILNINPDNVATPIAASLGDLTTLSLLAGVGGLLINAIETNFWVAPFIVAIFILFCPLWIWISSKNPGTREVLISGWSPVIFSMLISSAGGFILEYTVAKYKGIAVFQPVINGIGGNLVAVQASRISTSLHKESRLGVLPASAPALCFNPCQTFFGKRTHSKAARVLMSLVVPGHLVFIYMIHFLRAGHTSITPTFAILYCGAAVIQVFILLYSCVLMVNSLWKQKIDPDNSAIPYLTALGDLLGTALLAIAFHILHALGDRKMEAGE